MVVVARAVLARRGVGQRDQLEQRLRLGRQAVRRDHVAGELGARAPALAPLAGSKMLTPYALRSPARAAAVGTVSSRDPPSVLRVPW